eukprot:760981-Pyramimonas_sp.AAC.1
MSSGPTVVDPVSGVRSLWRCLGSPTISGHPCSLLLQLPGPERRLDLALESRRKWSAVDHVCALRFERCHCGLAEVRDAALAELDLRFLAAHANR